MRYFIQFIVLLILIQGTYAESIEANDLNNVVQEERTEDHNFLLD